MSHDRGCFRCGDDLPPRADGCGRKDCPYKPEELRVQDTPPAQEVPPSLSKEARRAYVQRPAVRAKRAAYYQKPAVKERRNAKQREHLAKNRDAVAMRRRVRKLLSLGLTEDQAIREIGKTKCDCCGLGFGKETPHIDHCHETGVYRGMVHLQCNVAMGMFKDNPGALNLAARYVDPFHRSKFAVDSGDTYLQLLHGIAEEDADGLIKAQQSYGNSWKQGGGMNAFAMLKRKWDRLLNRVSAPDISWDIFKAVITDTRGEGVIDDIRDLRRYLLLVEAEMRARGFDAKHRDNK